MNDFGKFTKFCEIPDQIKNQVTSFFEQNCKKNELWGQETLKEAYKKQLEHQVYVKIALFVRYDLVGDFEIFLVDSVFTANVFMYLQYYKVQKDELIYREKDPRDEIFFLVKG